MKHTIFKTKDKFMSTTMNIKQKITTAQMNYNNFSA